MILERAPAKVNLLLHVGPVRADGLHELCSIVASVDLADEVAVREAAGAEDTVVCPGVGGENLCHGALRAYRSAAPSAGLPPLEVVVEKRIPVAAGLGGGSADAAAVLRAANRIAGRLLDAPALRRVAASLGADVPSQVEPRHALIRGAGELVEPVALPEMALVLVPSAEGLATAEVYREADRLGSPRSRVDPDAVRALCAGPLPDLVAALGNDLQPAALSLRPELGRSIADLRHAGALAALLTGSGPTVFGVFGDLGAARGAAPRIRHATVSAVA
jgi:4-diphosphocytidyl-2-C-methyl-D-erythritol kinase